jgi:hypothetical protein
MKKLLFILLIGFASMAHAQHHNHRHHGGSRYGWIAPAVIGGIVTYELTRPAPVIVQQQPVIVQQYPSTPYGYHYENILDANCNCYRLVLVQN